MVRRVLASSTIWLLVGIPAFCAMASYSESTLSDAGEIVGDGTVVVLKPDTWTGKKFPLLEHIDIGNKLTSGLWLVLLHRHDCSACREAVSQYELLAKDFSTRSNCPAIALVECVPDAPNTEEALDGSLINGHLDDGHTWQLSGPTSVLIDAGTVHSVFTNARDVELVRAIWGGERS